MPLLPSGCYQYHSNIVPVSPSPSHNLTTSQPHNLTTSQPHNLTTSQPHPHNPHPNPNPPSLLYEPGEHPDHVVVIKYVPYVGDSKRAMDEYTSEIFMGGKNTIVMHNTCEDSLLAAPIILDLVLLAELLTRVQFKRDGEKEMHELHPVAALLSYLTKAPLVPQVRGFGAGCVMSRMWVGGSVQGWCEWDKNAPAYPPSPTNQPPDSLSPPPPGRPRRQRARQAARDAGELLPRLRWAAAGQQHDARVQVGWPRLPLERLRGGTESSRRVGPCRCAGLHRPSPQKRTPTSTLFTCCPERRRLSGSPLPHLPGAMYMI